MGTARRPDMMMLGRTAGALMWMARYLERIDTTARLLDAGFRLEITGADEQNLWQSVVATAGLDELYDATDEPYTRDKVIDFMLRGSANPSSVVALAESVKANAQVGRVTLPRDVWEAINGFRRDTATTLSRRLSDRDLPDVVKQLLDGTAQISGAIQTDMMRGTPFRFVRIGTFLERGDNTARVLDVKYYVLLPSPDRVGSWIDQMQWELILRSVSAYKAYRRHQSHEVDAAGIIEFLGLNRFQPRSLRYCVHEVCEHLDVLAGLHGPRESLDVAQQLVRRLDESSVESIVAMGPHEFLEDYVASLHHLSDRIEADYRFYS